MDRKFMDLALIRARRAGEDGEVPVGAVVVRDGKVIGTGRNRREKTHNALAHAEIEAINAACAETGDWRLDDCELYVTLEPCPMCSGAIINSRIKTVIFGAYDTKAGSLGSIANFANIPYSYTPEVYGGISENECRDLLTEFFKDMRK
ncbi:MAG: nucleoside deaminase [Ruminococcaceae bacterium]|nr:nucleoside deaminase [Oscillospiraceae bacterium]MEE1198563.1 nucleoside deaminase [Acutalibacteraceae bacterium]